MVSYCEDSAKVTVHCSKGFSSSDTSRRHTKGTSDKALFNDLYREK